MRRRSNGGRGGGIKEKSIKNKEVQNGSSAMTHNFDRPRRERSFRTVLFKKENMGEEKKGE